VETGPAALCSRAAVRIKEMGPGPETPPGLELTRGRQNLTGKYFDTFLLIVVLRGGLMRLNRTCKLGDILFSNPRNFNLDPPFLDFNISNTVGDLDPNWRCSTNIKEQIRLTRERGSCARGIGLRIFCDSVADPGQLKSAYSKRLFGESGSRDKPFFRRISQVSRAHQVQGQSHSRAKDRPVSSMCD